MIAKNISTKTKTFSGVAKYIADELKDAQTIAIDESLSTDIESMAIDFELQASMNNRVADKNKIGHITLSWHRDDSHKLTNEFMAELAQEYMKEMGIVNTQFVVARHFDTKNPHCHILFNKINNDGNLISSHKNFKKIYRVLEKMRKHHGLKFTEGKENVQINNLIGDQKAKHEIYLAVSKCRSESKSIPEMIKKLKQESVGVKWKTKGNTDVVEGIIFEKDGYTFSGSKIDRQFSYGNLCKYFEQQQQQSQTTDYSQGFDIDILPNFENVTGGVSDLAMGRKNEVVHDEKKKPKKKPLVYKPSF